jgi:hypothetical protein
MARRNPVRQALLGVAALSVGVNSGIVADTVTAGADLPHPTPGTVMTALITLWIYEKLDNREDRKK